MRLKRQVTWEILKMPNLRGKEKRNSNNTSTTEHLRHFSVLVTCGYQTSSPPTICQQKNNWGGVKNRPRKYYTAITYPIISGQACNYLMKSKHERACRPACVSTCPFSTTFMRVTRRRGRLRGCSRVPFRYTSPVRGAACCLPVRRVRGAEPSPQ